MLEKVVPLKGREAMSPYYRAFAVKAGAVSIEEAEGAFVDHHVRRQNQKTLLRNTDEKRARRLHKQQQAYAQGEGEWRMRREVERHLAQTDQQLDKFSFSTYSIIQSPWCDTMETFARGL